MSKFQAYKYVKEGVELSFTFQDDETAVVKKEHFISLMEEAINDLRKELTPNC